MEQLFSSELLNLGAIGAIAFVSFKTILDEKQEDRKMYRETLDSFNDKLDRFATALETSNHRLDNMDSKLEKIEETILNAPKK